MKAFTLGVTLLLGSVAAWAQPAAKQVDIFGQKIQYVEAGSGPNVILLHGLGGDAGNWVMTVPALASKYHVWAPDQIGFGGSDKPLINYRVGTLVDFLEGFCKKLGIDKAAVVGNSLGGWTAMAFALAHPERVEKLVLVDSAGYSFVQAGRNAPTRAEMATLNPSTLQGTKQLMSVIFANPSAIPMLTPEAMFARHLHSGDGYTINQFIDSILNGEDVLDGKLGGIKAPTLVIWGREDHLTPLASGQQFAKDIPGAQITILDKCGHVPQMECSAPFNAALTNFLGTGPTTSR
jgi:2-hydroxy-6-oxonona-2,4-dienedioate hydrolase